MHTAQPAAVQQQLQQNPIHVDSKWFKEVIALTGSMEEAMLLSDTMIYHHNRYKAFKVGDDYLYGLIYSAKDYEKKLRISYRKARYLPKQLVEKGFLEPHGKKFMCNRTFYTPTKKALDNLYKIHFSSADNDLENKQFLSKKSQSRISAKTNIKASISAYSPYNQSVQPLVQIRTTACANTHNPYKDKHKDKKNNNHNNLLKNYSLLENSKPQNVKTVIFDFNKFQLENIKCEATILDYFTIKQSEVINTITFCYHDNFDIVTFNQILNRPDLKKEAKDFKQLVTWAYFKATKENKVTTIDDKAESECHGMATLSVSPKTDHQTAITLPDITANTIQAMIDQRQKNKTYIADSTIENKPSDNKKIVSQNIQHTEVSPGNSKQTSPRQSAYLLTQSNQLHLIETLSEKGINDAALIIKTAENIFDEYANLSFNDLLDGIIYRLVTLPEKQKQQELINQALPMKLDNETGNVIDTADAEEEATDKPSENKNNKNFIADSPNQDVSVMAESGSKNIIETEETQEKITEQPNAIDEQSVSDSLNNCSTKTARSESKPITDIMVLKEKSQEKINEIKQDSLPVLLNESNQTLLIDGLNAAGIVDEKLIVDTAREIIVEYPDLKFQDLLEGVICRLVTLPSKQKKQRKINQTLTTGFENTVDNKNLEAISTILANQPKSIQTDNTPLPRLSDLTIPHTNTYVLRQDWASKAEQNFYTGSLPESQQLALVAMIDYVKRKGVTITIDQEVYEWLYHMASNKDYYYSRAKNFKHWCNIVMRQLMQRRLHKPAGFDGWRSRIEANSLAVAA